MDLKRIIRTGETASADHEGSGFSADLATAEKNRGTYPHPEKKGLCFFCFSVKEEK